MFAPGVGARLRAPLQTQQDNNNRTHLSQRGLDDMVCALARDDPQVVLALIEADIIPPDATILPQDIFRAPCGAINVVFGAHRDAQRAVDYGPLANRRPILGVTPLEVAILFGSIRSARVLIPVTNLEPSDVLQYLAHALYMLGHDLAKDELDAEGAFYGSIGDYGDGHDDGDHAADGDNNDDDDIKRDRQSRPYPVLSMVRLLVPLVDIVGPVPMRQHIIALQINPFTVLRQATVDAALQHASRPSPTSPDCDVWWLQEPFERHTSGSITPQHSEPDDVVGSGVAIVRWTDETGWRDVLDALLGARPDWLFLPAGDFGRRPWRLERRLIEPVVPPSTELAEAREAATKARGATRIPFGVRQSAVTLAVERLLGIITRRYIDTVGQP
jgi:hypothetical protein